MSSNPATSAGTRRATRTSARSSPARPRWRRWREPPTRELAWRVMAEGRAVSDAQGITLDTSPEELFDYAARKEVAYDHKPSMLQDVEAGRETEIDFLNGAVVSVGERHGVDAPLNRALTALVKGLERSRT